MSGPDLDLEAAWDGDAAAVVRLAAILAAGGPAATELRAGIALANQIGLVLAQPSAAAVERSLRERLAAEDDAPTMAAAVQHRLRLAGRRRWFWTVPLVAAAAVLALMLVRSVVTSPVAEADLGIAVVGGSGTVARRGVLIPLAVGDRLRADDRLSATGGLTLGSERGRFVIAAGGVLTLPSAACWSLESGGLLAAVRPAPTGFTVQTTDARIDVTGTRFSAFASPTMTLVRLHQGRVQVSAAGERRCQLEAGQELRVGAADPLAPADLSPWGPPQDLPIATDLAAWTVTRGHWRCEGDALIAAPDPAGSCRIESRQIFGDCRLTAQVRGRGPVRAEFQVGGYARFAVALPPLLDGDWHRLVLEHHGGVLQARLDGILLPLEEGDGHRDPGPCGFYASLGGRLEVREVRIAGPAPAGW